jgi:hypothetical protein
LQYDKAELLLSITLRQYRNSLYNSLISYVLYKNDPSDVLLTGAAFSVGGGMQTDKKGKWV